MGRSIRLDSHLYRLYPAEGSLEPLRGVNGRDPAVVDDSHPIAELVGLLDLVGGQKDGRARGIHLPH
jgi:hypothetical protein